MTIKDYEKTMRQILCYVREGNIENQLFKFNETEIQCLKECVDKQYITGLHTAVTVSGRIVVDVGGAIRITQAGLAFLDFKPDRRHVPSLIMSILALAFSILFNFDKVIRNTQLLLKWLTKG